MKRNGEFLTIKMGNYFVIIFYVVFALPNFQILSWESAEPKAQKNSSHNPDEVGPVESMFMDVINSTSGNSRGLG